MSGEWEGALQCILQLNGLPLPLLHATPPKYLCYFATELSEATYVV